MTNTQSHAKRELEILFKTTPDAIIREFETEILALCEKFGQSGQSGGSAPFTAGELSHAIKKLCLQQTIAPLTGEESEWGTVADEINQNNREGAVFKNGDGRAYYLDAIVWKGVEEYDTFTGGVYIDDKNFEFIRSSQFVKFPFKPKTFYIDVVRISITKEEAEIRDLHYIEDSFGDCYYTIIKDPKQLDKVFEYYDKN